MGHSQTRRLAQNPLLREMWELYLYCRSTTLVIFKKPDKTRKGAEKLMPIVWPTGFAQLPYEGGIEDQPHFEMKMMFACMQGEREGIARRMQTG